MDSRAPSPDAAAAAMAAGLGYSRPLPIVVSNGGHNRGRGGRHIARVVQASFEQSASAVEQCPAPDVPEVAIAGRSNVGKSSLLNALCSRRGLARVSRTPGRTQLLNLFQLVLERDAVRTPMRLVDLPGYGFAAAGRAVTQRFGPMIEGYLTERPTLVGLVLLIDLRRGITDLDRQMIEFLSARELPTLLVATKADKLGASKRPLAAREIAKALGVHASDVLLTSATASLGIHGAGGLVDDLADMVVAADDQPHDHAEAVS